MPVFDVIIDKGDDTHTLTLLSPAAITIRVGTDKLKAVTTYQLALTDEGLILEEITSEGDFGETLATVPYDEHSDHVKEGT